jgi:CheY-like chemotaxis protein
MRVLIVDDDLRRTVEIMRAVRKKYKRNPEFWMAQTGEEAINILRFMAEDEWDLVFLDHDLAGWDGDYKDGRDVALALRKTGVEAKRIVIQSVNHDGGREMESILADYKVTLAPYPDVLAYLAGIPKKHWPTTKMFKRWEGLEDRALGQSLLKLW